MPSLWAVGKIALNRGMRIAVYGSSVQSVQGVAGCNTQENG